MKTKNKISITYKLEREQQLSQHCSRDNKRGRIAKYSEYRCPKNNLKALIKKNKKSP